MSTHYEPGRYQAEITQQAMGKASTGTPQFILRIRLLGQYVYGADAPQGCEDYERTIYRSITSNTMQYLERDLETLGFEGHSLALLDPQTPGYTDLTGRVVDVICRHESGQDGAPREKWSLAWERSNGDLVTEALAPGDYRALDALFGRSKGKPAPKAPAPKPTPKVMPKVPPRGVPPMDRPTVPDDDVPF